MSMMTYNTYTVDAILTDTAAAVGRFGDDAVAFGGEGRVGVACHPCAFRGVTEALRDAGLPIERFESVGTEIYVWIAT